MCTAQNQREIVEAMAVLEARLEAPNAVAIMMVCRLSVIKRCISFSYLELNTPIPSDGLFFLFLPAHACPESFFLRLLFIYRVSLIFFVPCTNSRFSLISKAALVPAKHKRKE